MEGGDGSANGKAKLMLAEENLFQIMKGMVRKERRYEMKKTCKTLTSILATVMTILFLLSFAGAVSAAELNLKKFTVSPSPFKKGQTVRISVEVENPNSTAASTAGKEIYAYVKDGTPGREGPGSFLGKTPLPATIGPRATITVNLAQTYMVPNNAGNEISFTIHLPAITPGVEFGPAFSYKFNATCTYSPEIRFRPLGPMKPLHVGK
jgi:hypothetical protein